MQRDGLPKRHYDDIHFVSLLSSDDEDLGTNHYQRLFKARKLAHQPIDQQDSLIYQRGANLEDETTSKYSKTGPIFKKFDTYFVPLSNVFPGICRKYVQTHLTKLTQNAISHGSQLPDIVQLWEVTLDHILSLDTYPKEIVKKESCREKIEVVDWYQRARLRATTSGMVHYIESS